MTNTDKGNQLGIMYINQTRDGRTYLRGFVGDKTVVGFKSKKGEYYILGEEEAKDSPTAKKSFNKKPVARRDTNDAPF